MGRDSGGTYTSPSGQFSSGTTISSSVMNGKLNDIGSELSDSLSRTGKGGMNARLRGVDGTSALPAYAFTDETTLGLWRAGTADLRVGNNGTDLFKWTATENRSLQALKVSSGGLTIDAGGATVTAGGLTITAGGLTVSAGGASVIASLPTQAGVVGGSTLEITSAASFTTTSGHTYPLSTLAKATPNNVVRLNARLKNDSAVTDWHEQSLGITYDVDNTVGSGGSFYLGFTGAKLTSGTTATGADPANALELTNGNLKLSGTAPNKDEALANTLTPANICKAWAHVITTGGATTATISDGFNVASVSVSGVDIIIVLAAAVATPGCPVATAAVDGLHLIAVMNDSTHVQINGYAAGSATQFDFEAGGSRTVNLVLFGR